MSIDNLSTVASDVIASYGKTAKNVIHAYRAGGTRAIGFVDQRFESVVERRAKRISPSVRDNLVSAQKTISGYYVKGIQLTTGGADSVIDTVVDLAAKGVQRIASNAATFDKASGMHALDTLSSVVLPGAQVVSKVASKIEQQLGQVADKIAGEAATVEVAPAKRKAVRKPLKAAPAKRTAARKTRSRKA